MHEYHKVSRALWPNCQQMHPLPPQQTRHLTQIQGPFSCQPREEAVSSTSVCDQGATGKEVPRPSTFGLNTRLRQALTSASPMTVGAFKLPWPGRGKSAPSNGSSSGTAPCCSRTGFFFFFFFTSSRDSLPSFGRSFASLNRLARRLLR